MDNKDNNRKNNTPNRMFIIITLAAALLIWYMGSMVRNQLEENTKIEISYDKFMDMLDKNEIAKVESQADRIVITPKTQPNTTPLEITYYTGHLFDPYLVDKLDEAGVEYNAKVVDNKTTIFDTIIQLVLPFVLIYVVMFFLFKAISKNSGGMMGVGKSNAKVYVEKQTGVSFKEIGRASCRERV